MKALALAAICLIGCKDKSEGAVSKFATEFSCPEAQVTIKARTDLDPGEELAPDFTKTPSAEVAADPVRLAKFTEDQAKLAATWKSSYGDYEMFEVSGCGHMQIVGCHHPTGQRGGQRMDLVSCDQSRRQEDEEDAAKKAAKQKAKDEAKQARDAAKAARDAARHADH